MFKKEVERLVFMEVLEKENDYEWGSPYFDQPKTKSYRVHFPIKFSNLNRQFEHNPNAMTKINKILFKIEDLKYATSLSLYIGYYIFGLVKT